MKAYNLDTVARDLGHCCGAAFLKIEEIKAHARGEAQISAARLKGKTDFSYRTCFRILAKWKQGEVHCKNQPTCMKEKLGGKDPESTIDPIVKAFQQLRGEAVTLYTAKFGKYEIVRELPTSPAIITELSRIPWLWIKVAIQGDREVYLGDLVWIENIAYGTVFDIDGNILYILLPGHRHKSRRKG